MPPFARNIDETNLESSLADLSANNRDLHFLGLYEWRPPIEAAHILGAIGVNEACVAHAPTTHASTVAVLCSSCATIVELTTVAKSIQAFTPSGLTGDAIAGQQWRQRR